MKILSDQDASPLPFDWDSLRTLPREIALLAAQQWLQEHEGAEERIFVQRMRVLGAVDELELWKDCVDPEVGEPFASMERFVRVLYPKGWRYSKDALETAQKLAAVPFPELEKMSVANMKVLAGVSSNLLKMAAVLRAAQTLTKDQLVDHLNAKHHQHLERKLTLVPEADMDELDQAIGIAMEETGCKNRADAIKEIAVFYIQEIYLARQRKHQETA